MSDHKGALRSACMAVALTAGCAMNVDAGTEPLPESAIEELAPARLRLSLVGSHATGVFNDLGAEIAAYDPSSRRLFSVSAGTSQVNVLDIRNPSAPALVGVIAPTGQPNSAAVSDGVVAVAVQGALKTDPGLVQFYNASTLALLSQVTVGSLPDMITFTPDGRYALVANEGEPSDDYTIDPEGSVSVISMYGGASRVTQASVTTIPFDDSIRTINAASVRVYGPNANRARDLEPEYIAVSDDSRTAWITLQENNAIAELDIRRRKFTRIAGLGFKNHMLAKNALDPSDKDGEGGVGAIEFGNWPVLGMYQPDGIHAFQARGNTYFVTANEGDVREYTGYSELTRVKDLVAAGKLDSASPAFAHTSDAELGRLRVTTATGDTDGDGDIDVLHAFGARSFSVWSSDIEQVFDSGDEMERRMAELEPTQFNSTNDANQSFDSRSDDKGPEPENVTTGKLWGRTYAFVGLERIGGVMVYDVSRPSSPEFVTYFNNRDFTPVIDATNFAAAKDLGPEGLLFIAPEDSPDRTPLLVLSNEVSGTTTILRISRDR
ncbi:MAG: choice-of-anchor I family protein [Polyangiaceae bacterium]